MRSLLAVAALAVLGLTACSSSDEPRDSEPPAGVPSPEDSSSVPEDDVEELRSAVQAYSDAYLTGETDAAFGLLTQRCQDTIGGDDFAEVVGEAAEAYGSALPFETFDAEIGGTTASVTYTYDVESIDQEGEPWVLTDGQWLNDDC